jgi:hypothetical protein
MPWLYTLLWKKNSIYYWGPWCAHGCIIDGGWIVPKYLPVDSLPLIRRSGSLKHGNRYQAIAALREREYVVVVSQWYNRYVINRKRIRSLMALQAFVGPWPLLQFRNLFYTGGGTPWTSVQPVARLLPAHMITQTQNKRTHRHPCLEWNSNWRSQRSRERDSSGLRSRGDCDRPLGCH